MEITCFVLSSLILAKGKACFLYRQEAAESPPVSQGSPLWTGKESNISNVFYLVLLFRIRQACAHTRMKAHTFARCGLTWMLAKHRATRMTSARPRESPYPSTGRLAALSGPMGSILTHVLSNGKVRFWCQRPLSSTTPQKWFDLCLELRQVHRKIFKSLQANRLMCRYPDWDWSSYLADERQNLEHRLIVSRPRWVWLSPFGLSFLEQEQMIFRT